MRKTILLAALPLLLAAAGLSAQPPLREPVEVPAIGFKAILNDGRVISTWRRYKRDDFTSYKLVKSLNDSKLVFPELPAIFSSDAPGDLRFEDGKLAEGTWHYRLCIITRFGDRWVSPVATVTITAADLKRAAPTEADFEPL